MPDAKWTEVGHVDELKQKPLQEIMCGMTPIALTYQNGSFAAISGVCNHVGAHWGKGCSTATMSSAPGAIGSFTIEPAKENRAMSRIRFRPTQSKSRTADMERNIIEVQNSRELREGAQELVTRAADMAKFMVEGQLPDHPLVRGGRKAHQLDSEATG